MVPLLSWCKRHDVPRPSPLASFFSPTLLQALCFSRVLLGVGEALWKSSYPTVDYTQYAKTNHCFLLFVGSGYFVSFAGASSLSAAFWCNFPQGHRIRWFLSSIVSLGDIPSKRSLASPISADCSPSLLPVLTLGLHCPPWNSLCLSPDLDSPFSWTLCLAFSWFTPLFCWSTPSGSFVRWIWWYGARGHCDDGLHSRCLSRVSLVCAGCLGHRHLLGGCFSILRTRFTSLTLQLLFSISQIFPLGF